ncbi:MAG: hypothetical protein VX346_11800 [Planctomycetota bacterium]|nr:hypothetical protein [Planctomycetota bacterium]
MQRLTWILAVLGCLVEQPPTAVTAAELLPLRSNYLLLDGRVVAQVENAHLRPGVVQRHPANPLFAQTLPWEVDISHLYANVLFDKQEELYKCWYFTRITEWREDLSAGGWLQNEMEQGNMATLYATSRDGIHWEKPGLDVYRYRGQPTNIIMFGNHGAGIFKDLQEADPARRYKMLTGRMPHGKVDACFSADGIRWSKRVHVFDARGDCHNNAFWAENLNRYVAITREYPGSNRVVMRTESEDFNTWKKPVEVLRGPITKQTYSMPAFPYEGVYLGLVSIFRIATDERVHVELAWSPDTLKWNRVAEGQPFLALSETPGHFEWGCLYAAARPIVTPEGIRIYYSGASGIHSWQEGKLCLATLRTDGWAGYTTIEADREATLETVAMRYGSRPLTVTADAQGGSVLVTLLGKDGTVLATSEPITGNVTREKVVWEEGGDATLPKGSAVRLRFHFKNAVVYSFGFGG